MKKSLKDIGLRSLVESPVFVKERDPIRTEEERLAQKKPENFPFEIGSLWINRESNNCWILLSRKGNTYQWETFEEAMKKNNQDTDREAAKRLRQPLITQKNNLDMDT